MNSLPGIPNYASGQRLKQAHRGRLAAISTASDRILMPAAVISTCGSTVARTPKCGDGATKRRLEKKYRPNKAGVGIMRSDQFGREHIHRAGADRA